MGRGSYLGGSTLIRPGSSWFGKSKRSKKKKKKENPPRRGRRPSQASTSAPQPKKSMEQPAAKVEQQVVRYGHGKVTRLVDTAKGVTVERRHGLTRRILLDKSKRG